MKQPQTTFMAQEIEEMPEAAARLTEAPAQAAIRSIASELRDLDPAAIITVARGSSDHAATYLNYSAQMLLGLPVASIGPSIASIYETPLKAKGLAVLAISQSGASEDIRVLSESLAEAGAQIVALTNTATSPLAEVASSVINIAAGKERAVAATKSCFNSIVAGLWLLAEWAEDQELASALTKLPDCMRRLEAEDGLAILGPSIRTQRRAVVLGRGAGLGIANEVALKLIETCGVHASSYSGAEVLHGPSAMLVDGHPVLAITSGTKGSMDPTIERLEKQGANLVALSPKTATGHPLVDPLLDMQPLYRGLERLAVSFGMDPDNPEHLQKETRTV